MDIVAANLMIGPDRKQELLEGDEAEERLLLLLETLIQENEFIARRERDRRAGARQLRAAAAKGVPARAA